MTNDLQPKAANDPYVLWAKIKSIEFVGYEQVYDIEVEGTHNFIANGIVAHNTYISGNVGIGTTGPASKLEIEAASVDVRLDRTGVDGNAYLNFSDNGTGKILLGIKGGGTGEENDFVIADGSQNIRMLVETDTGNVGIGVTVPSSKLDVTTNALGTAQTNTSGIALVNTTLAAAGLQQISPAIRFRGEGWRTNTPAGSFWVDFRSYVIPVQGTSLPTGYFTIESSVNDGAYTNRLTIDSGGNVGIGTTAPGAKLDVAGNIYVRRNDRVLLDSDDTTADSYIRYDSTNSRISIFSDGVEVARAYKKP